MPPALGPQAECPTVRLAHAAGGRAVARPPPFLSATAVSWATQQAPLHLLS